MDGLVTTFAIVAGAAGAGFSAGIILIVGFANVFADGFSMGTSSYLSATSEQETHGHSHTKHPLAKATVTFVSFVIVGLIPLAPFLLAFFIPTLGTYAVYASVAATTLAFGSVGYVSGVVLDRNPVLRALRNILIGSLAAGIAFGVGHVLSSVFGV